MKSNIKKSLSKWWTEAKEKYSPEEIIKFLQSNKSMLEEHISNLDNNKYLYRWSHYFFSLIAILANIADWIVKQVQRFLLLFPGIKILIQKITDWKNHLNFKELIEFLRTKLYSLRSHPHNERDVKVIDDIMEFAKKHGFDYKKVIPQAQAKFLEKKNQLLQHKFFQEFSKTSLERLLAIQFPFNRSIFPVLPDFAFWHKLFEFLEGRVIIDIILFNKNKKQVSFKKSAPEEISSTDVIKTLKNLNEIKKKKRRIFFVGHHEGYLGPYFVRSVIRKLGFDTLAKNCNTIVGPRMLSNVVMRNGAANVGNLFITVPSQKTTAIQTQGLVEELKKTAKRTQCLIKMPNSGLKLINELDYNTFMKAFVNGNSESFKTFTSSLDSEELKEFKNYFKAYDFSESMQDLSIEDYNLFKNIMDECFLLFPEGSRSNIDHDGSVVMKYFNPKYFAAYMRPGDYIAPISVAGGSDFARGWILRSATFGISIGDPFEVTAKMMKNFEEAGISVMRKIAALPNIKKVLFKEDVQFKKS